MFFLIEPELETRLGEILCGRFGQEDDWSRSGAPGGLWEGM